MAGIGFELKKMFQKKGLFAILKAYGYAGIVCVGPTILGIILLLGIRLLAGIGGAGEQETELLNCMITYTLIASILITNTFSLITTRYTADQLYEEKKDAIMPSFWGSIAIMLIIGELFYGIFLHFSGASPMNQFLCLMFFGEMIVVWTEINYLTAIKDYTGIIITFAISLIASWIVGYVLLTLKMDIIQTMLFCVCFAYGIMMVSYYVLLIRFFPKGNHSCLCFLEWFDQYPQLPFLGMFLGLGLFGHIVIMWRSPLQQQIQGLFYAAPVYDIAALLAFFSIMITTINFVTSIEVNFYPKYRKYFMLFNDGGSLTEIKQTEHEMIVTLQQELTYTFTKQFFSTIIFIVAGTLLLPKLPLGMTEEMLGVYRVLCIGYAFYATGNCLMLIQLYFSDNKGALISGTSFMVVSIAGTLFLHTGDSFLYGLGFMLGGIVFSLVALVLLYRYISQLMYHVLCNQPIIVEETKGILTRISKLAEKRYNAKKLS